MSVNRINFKTPTFPDRGGAIFSPTIYSSGFKNTGSCRTTALDNNNPTTTADSIGWGGGRGNATAPSYFTALLGGKPVLIFFKLYIQDSISGVDFVFIPILTIRGM